MLSTNACHDASMMLSCAPTVPHSSSPSLDVTSARTFVAVPVVASSTRTL